MNITFFSKQEIQSGLFGQVFKGEDDIKRTVAVKFFKHEYYKGLREQAMEHARAFAKVSHENVVQLHGIEDLDHPVTGDKQPAVVMEWIEGERFGTWIKNRDLTEDSAIALADQLVSGLEALHDKDVTHNDLHDNNVLVTSEQALKIIDPNALGETIISTASFKHKLQRDASDCGKLCKELLACTERGKRGLDAVSVMLADAISTGDIRKALAAFARGDESFVSGLINIGHESLGVHSASEIEQCMDAIATDTGIWSLGYRDKIEMVLQKTRDVNSIIILSNRLVLDDDSVAFREISRVIRQVPRIASRKESYKHTAVAEFLLYRTFMYAASLSVRYDKIDTLLNLLRIKIPYTRTSERMSFMRYASLMNEIGELFPDYWISDLAIAQEYWHNSAIEGLFYGYVDFAGHIGAAHTIIAFFDYLYVVSGRRQGYDRNSVNDKIASHLWYRPPFLRPNEECDVDEYYQSYLMALESCGSILHQVRNHFGDGAAENVESYWSGFMRLHLAGGQGRRANISYRLDECPFETDE